MKSLAKFAVCALMLCSASGSHADEWVFGIGGADLFDEIRAEAAAGLIEYHFDPFLERSWGSVSWMITAQFDSTDNQFLGVGAYAYRPFKRNRFFLEGSLAVGGYHQGTYVGKQADDLLFRSSVGIGYRLKDESRISLSADHLLDKKFTFDNPGKEAILLRYTKQF